MKNPPACQWYWSDWLVDTAGLAPDVKGVYIDLLAHCWVRNGLPDDDRMLRRLGGLGERKTARNVRILGAVRALFIKNPHGEVGTELHHKRLLEELGKQRNYKERQSLAGKKGAQVRWQPHSDPNGNPTVPPMAKNGSSSSTTSPRSYSGTREIYEHRDTNNRPLDEKPKAPPNGRPDKLAHDRKDYLEEVLTKKGGAVDDRTRAILFLVGKHVPDYLIQRAQAEMQDAWERSRNPESGFPALRNPVAYFLARIKVYCREDGIETTIRWRDSAPVSEMDASEVESQEPV